MRKRIAVFANGWSSELIQEMGKSFNQVATDHDYDIYAFINYSAHADTYENSCAEMNIFKLPDLSLFDGAIVMASTFNTSDEIDYVHNELLRTGIPSISLEYRLDGIDYIGTDDYSGMYNLTEHLILEHGVHNIVFMGGIESHAGNRLRLTAVLDACAKHNIIIPDDAILYGDFSAGPAIDAFDSYRQSHSTMPDAIICANDVMAVGISDHMKELGLSIPKDIIVTGFDCLAVARNYDPSITSVNREWMSMGKQCMEYLIEKIEGSRRNINIELSTHLVCGRSCGCKLDNITLSQMHTKSGKTRYSDGFFCDQHFRHMYLAMRKATTAEQLHDSLSYYFTHEGWMEGPRTLIAFHPNFFISEKLESIKSNNYPDEMDIICHTIDDQSTNIVHQNTQEIISTIAQNASEPGTYVFVPIRIDDITFGFAGLSQGFDLFQNDILYLWCRHMSEYTEQVKSNIMIKRLNERLEALSVTDALTNVYNRTGCETIIYPALAANQQQGGQSIVMLADVDRLKYINDKYGHGCGDTAISLATIALQKALPSDFLIGRYGGDEFLIAGCVDTACDLEELVNKIDATIEDEAISHKLQFKLRISVGAIQLEKGQAFDISECIKKSDNKLYLVKEQHHNELS